jgi:hypothetical protein
VTVEVGTEKFQARASTVEGDDRQRLYDEQAKMMPAFSEYLTKTSRQIPVVALERLG